MLQVDGEAAAGAEEEGRPLGAEARAVGGDQHVGLRSSSLFSAQSSRRPGEPISSPISIRYLALKPSRPRVSSTARERRDVDGVLALVVDDAAAVPAAVRLGQRQGERPSLQSRVEAADRHRRGRSRRRSAGAGSSMRSARGTALGLGVVQDAAGEAERLERRPHLVLEVVAPAPRRAPGSGFRSASRRGAPSPASRHPS